MAGDSGEDWEVEIGEEVRICIKKAFIDTYISCSATLAPGGGNYWKEANQKFNSLVWGVRVRDVVSSACLKPLETNSCGSRISISCCSMLYHSFIPS